MPKPRSNSQALAAYEALKKAIVSGELTANTRVRENDLSDQYGMSRTPVREALKRLEDEGLLTRRPGMGLVVTTLDQNAITQLYIFREILEGGAARLAAQHADEVEIEYLHTLLEQARQGADPVESNYLLHQTIYAASHNPFLIKAINQLIDSTALLGQSTLAHTGRPEIAQREHLAIVNAIEARNAEAAEAAARQHIRQALRARLQQRGPLPISATLTGARSS